MIIDIWRPNRTKGQIVSYSMVDNVIKTGYKVRYLCDECDDGVIYNSTTSSMMKSKWNNMHFQMCRKCRTRKSENDIKQTTISFEVFKRYVISCGYRVISNSYDFNKQSYPSQSSIRVVCPNGHEYDVIYNNFVNKSRRCRKCYDDNRYHNSVSSLSGWLLYQQLVRMYSNKEYNKHYDNINPHKLQRGTQRYHLDHKYSISEGFKNNIPVYIIGSYHNLEMLGYRDNIIKSDGCSITKEQLLNNYENNK